MKNEYPELSVLSAQQLWGDDNTAAVGVFEHCGTKSAVTDLAIVCGCEVSYANSDAGEALSERCGWSYTSTADGRWSLIGADENGNRQVFYRKRHDGAVRPCFYDKDLAGKLAAEHGADCTFFKTTLGEYPQMAADVMTTSELTKARCNDSLVRTGKVYTFCANTFRGRAKGKFIEKHELVQHGIAFEDLYERRDANKTFCSYGESLRHGGDTEVEEFLPEVYDEYGFKGEKYICFKARPKTDSNEFELSNGLIFHAGDLVWLKVEPVCWYVDVPTGLFVAEKCLVSGIRFQKQVAVDSYSFAESEMHEYLNKYMAQEIFSVSEADELSETEVQQLKKRTNPYGFDFNKVSEEDIIRGGIESGVAVFLHGLSSEGKSARVRQIDPECVIIYLRNATPDSLNGKSVYNAKTGQMTDIKPTWLTKLEKRCEAAPECFHVLFFDELTNALPSIQGSAFNIILDREVNGVWQLPANARIVAAGNELKDSLAANHMAEPLFNRFAHVYIHTELDAWLGWASANGIHPAIYTYIACRDGQPLRSEYNGQLPNADPRKWEMASKMLYASGKPEMLRSLVGEVIAADFCNFCRTTMITPDDVLSGEAEKMLGELNKAEKHTSAVCLSQVSEAQLAQVRSFVQLMGAQYVAVFDSLWAHGDYARLEKIARLKAQS